MRNGEEIQAALRQFVATWMNYQGTEQSEAQSFLNGLVGCYGVDRQAAGMLFEHTVPIAGRMLQRMRNRRWDALGSVRR